MPVQAVVHLQDKELFPLYIDRFPIQLLAFLRLARIQDVAQLASATFERDVIISPLNEYEVLQLVMGDLRERLQEYLDNQVRGVLAGCRVACLSAMLQQQPGVGAAVAAVQMQGEPQMRRRPH